MAQRATTEAPAPTPLPFERRREDRWPARGAATARRVGGDRFGETSTLKLVDCSEQALGAIAEQALEPGAIVAVDFHAPGVSTRRGVVLRCLPCGQGYRLAIRFEAALAA